MSSKLTPGTALMLTVPPLLWAGNAVVGRMVGDLVPPITLNFLRWVFAFFILLPLSWPLLRPSSGLWTHWKRFALLGLLAVGSYNALQYLALHTSTPLNVTLVGSSGPIWTLAMGALFFKVPVRRMQVYGALLSIAGVTLVLARGDWATLMQVQMAPGDLFILLATVSWSWYSWLLLRRDEPEAIRQNWAAFLQAQVVFGLGWSGLFAGLEWGLTDAHIDWGWPLVATLVFVSVGPSVLAYRCWGLGVQQAGPTVAGFFANLSPLFTAVMSAAFLGEMPRPYHLMAFVLIVGGIVVSSRR